ncbi:Lumazine-binding protein [Xylariaceae sp. FL0804]|nr:Lumazine-binding protein [Xylariaceae sp. FL0804]
MFTGLVEEIGVVEELNANDETGGTSLTIAVPAGSTLLADAALGDSISVNGVCLTATELLPSSPDPSSSSKSSSPPTSSSNEGGKDASPPPPRAFKVGIAPETLRLTNLGLLRAGDGANLERAVRADTRLGGHFVQGHVDGVADVVSVTPDGNALTVRLAPRAQNNEGGDYEAEGGGGGKSSSRMLRYVVRKGYVALDGASLTVTRVDDEQGWFEVMLVQYTQSKIVLAKKRAGDSVNLEVDVLAKYAEKSMAGYLGTRGEQLLQPVIEKMVQSMVAQGLGGHPGPQP